MLPDPRASPSKIDLQGGRPLRDRGSRRPVAERVRTPRSHRRSRSPARRASATIASPRERPRRSPGWFIASVCSMLREASRLQCSVVSIWSCVRAELGRRRAHVSGRYTGRVGRALSAAVQALAATRAPGKLEERPTALGSAYPKSPVSSTRRRPGFLHAMVEPAPRNTSLRSQYTSDSSHERDVLPSGGRDRARARYGAPRSGRRQRARRGRPLLLVQVVRADDPQCHCRRCDSPTKSRR